MYHLPKSGDSFEITIEDNCQRWAGGFKTYFVHSMFTLPHLTLQSTIIPKEGGVISFSDDEKISLRQVNSVTQLGTMGRGKIMFLFSLK